MTVWRHSQVITFLELTRLGDDLGPQFKILVRADHISVLVPNKHSTSVYLLNDAHWRVAESIEQILEQWRESAAGQDFKSGGTR